MIYIYIYTNNIIYTLCILQSTTPANTCERLCGSLRIKVGEGGSPHMGHSKVIIFESHVLIVSHSILWAKI